MAKKSQHGLWYSSVPALLKQLRIEAGLTQRELGATLNKPQSYVYNCETSNRRVDAVEFALWAAACSVDPRRAFARLLDDLRERRAPL